MRTDIYQVMPPLTEEEFDALKERIAESGVQVPVEYDEDGNILDGYHRVQACRELGIEKWPTLVRKGLTEQQKIEHALLLNTNRRQVPRSWKQQKVKELRQQGWSYRRIARALGVPKTTVERWLGKSPVPSGTPETVIGTDGKEYPAVREQTLEPTGNADSPEDEPQQPPAKVSTVEVFKNDDEESAVNDSALEEESPSQQRHDAALRMSESNEWYTPAKYIEAAREVMGHIDVDPASCYLANETVQAELFYDKETNGLTKDWQGKVWLNPPYGGLSADFTHKLLEQYRQGITTEAILLVNANSTETKWFQPLWDYLLCFIDHRINFQGPREAKNGSTHGSVFVYFGSKERRFAEIFRQFGVIVKRWDP